MRDGELVVKSPSALTLRVEGRTLRNIVENSTYLPFLPCLPPHPVLPLDCLPKKLLVLEALPEGQLGEPQPQIPQSRCSPVPGRLAWGAEPGRELGTLLAPWPGCPRKALALNDCMWVPCSLHVCGPPAERAILSRCWGGEGRKEERRRFSG